MKTGLSLLAALFAAIVAAAPAARAADAPALPCATGSFPAAPAVGAPPAIGVWQGTSLGPAWQAPPSTGWETGPVRLVVSVAGQFRGPATTDEILAKAGAISQLKAVRYWSISGQRWKNMLSGAEALTGQDARQVRGDFSAAEMRSGAGLFFSANDSGMGSNAIYRARVVDQSPDRVAVEIANVTRVSALLITLFHPGDLRSFCVVQRQPDGSWSYHSLLRIDGKTNSLIQGDGGSYVNRAFAYYRHIAGIATDQEPPAIR